jgi:hypothetical protein
MRPSEARVQINLEDSSKSDGIDDSETLSQFSRSGASVIKLFWGCNL